MSIDHNIKEMHNRELLRYFEALKFTNQHIKQMLAKDPSPDGAGVDWVLALRRRDEILQDTRREILLRMERGTNATQNTEV